MRLSADGVVRDSGLPDVVAASARQHAVEELPAENPRLSPRQPLLRDRPAFSDVAWKAVRNIAAPAGARVQAICDFVHRHIAFGYEHARASYENRL